MKTEYIHLPFEIKAVEDDGYIEGYGAVFGNVDLGFDRIEPGAFKSSLRGRNASNPLPILWQHNSAEPIGVWEKAFEDTRGLYVEGRLNLSKESGQADVPMAWKARALAKQRAVKGLSIGFYAEDYKYEGEIRVLTKVEVVEVSMATFPMNPLAQIVGAKCTNKQFVQALREGCGLSRNEAEAVRAGGLTSLRNYRQSGDPAERAKALLSKIRGEDE